MGIRGSRAVRCDGCRLHSDLCLCDALPRLRVAPALALFIHAHELPRPSNTGHLVVRMIEGARMIVVGAKEQAPRYTPLGAHRQLLLHPDGRPLTAADARDQVELLVADGTWHQARHMSQRIEALRDAERVRVVAPSTSRPRLRRDGREGHVCTLEAVAHALGVLGWGEAEAAMLDVYGLFVERTLARRYKCSRLH